MSPCARGCCWTGFQVCAKQRTCACHWDERKPRSRSSGGTNYRDPVPNQAIYNIEKDKRKK